MVTLCKKIATIRLSQIAYTEQKMAWGNAASAWSAQVRTIDDATRTHACAYIFFETIHPE